LDQGLLIRVRGKTGWREVEIGRGSSELTCPVVALQTWLRLGRIAHGPLFRRIAGAGKEAEADRLTDRHVARLVKRTALAAGVRGDLSEGERRQKFSGHSLRAGLATAAQADERYVQRQLGHASVEMTRRYQRQRGRFRVNRRCAFQCVARSGGGQPPGRAYSRRLPRAPLREARGQLPSCHRRG
jgi:integrase